MTKKVTLALCLAVMLGAAACDDDDDGGAKDGGPLGDGGAGDTGGPADMATSEMGEVGLGAGNLGSSTDKFVVYDNPFGDNRPNPAANISGSARADSAGPGMMTITLEVSGMPAGMKFGSHVHKLACTDNKAGGHYQHNPAPNADGGADGGPTDPTYANPTNEAWLDFTVGTNGKAIGMATVAWVPAMADAKAIMVHAMATGDGGVAGAKLACLPFAFK